MSTPADDAGETAANPILADALTYYADRRSMNNPKGWDHVERVVKDALAKGRWDATTPDERAHALEVLRALVAADSEARAEVDSLRAEVKRLRAASREVYAKFHAIETERYNLRVTLAAVSVSLNDFLDGIPVYGPVDGTGRPDPRGVMMLDISRDGFRDVIRTILSSADPVSLADVRVADRVAALLCERHQVTSPTRQPCAACVQDATEAVTCTVCDEVILPEVDATPDRDRYAHRDCMEEGE